MEHLDVLMHCIIAIVVNKHSESIQSVLGAGQFMERWNNPYPFSNEHDRKGEKEQER